jgi:hypothetical protein
VYKAYPKEDKLHNKGREGTGNIEMRWIGVFGLRVVADRHSSSGAAAGSLTKGEGERKYKSCSGTQRSGGESQGKDTFQQCRQRLLYTEETCSILRGCPRHMHLRVSVRRDRGTATRHEIKTMKGKRTGRGHRVQRHRDMEQDTREVGA